MKIGGLQKLTLIDFPGKLACTVFLVGCNFRCPFCYSGELVMPEKIKGHPTIPEKDFLGFLRKKKGLLEAVVICGGEPCINDDLPEFCGKIKKMGFLVKLDTNGSKPEMLKKLIKEKLIDYVAMDVKTSFGNQKYDKATGMKIFLGKVKKSIEIIKNSGIDYEFRTTVVPTIHSKEDIIELAKALSPAKKYYLQNFRPEKTINPAFEKIKPYPQEFLLKIQKEISPFFEVCRVR